MKCKYASPSKPDTHIGLKLLSYSACFKNIKHIITETNCNDGLHFPLNHFGIISGCGIFLRKLILKPLLAVH